MFGNYILYLNYLNKSNYQYYTLLFFTSILATIKDISAITFIISTILSDILFSQTNNLCLFLKQNIIKVFVNIQLSFKFN